MAKPKQRKGLGDLIGETLATEEAKPEGVAEIVNLKTASKAKSKTVNTSLYLARPVHRQVRELAFTEDVKPHDLYLEALDMLFKQRGLKSIRNLTTS